MLHPLPRPVLRLMLRLVVLQLWITSGAGRGVGVSRGEMDALRDAVRDAGWTEASVVCEEAYCDSLQNQWESVVPVTFFAVTGNSGTLQEGVMTTLARTMDLGSRHVVIAASNNVLMQTLQIINVADGQLGQDSILTHAYEWLLMGWTGEPAELAGTVDNIVNIALMSHKGSHDVFTCEFAPRGRHFSRVDNGADIFPNKNYGLNGKHLVVGTNYWGRIMHKDEDSTADFNGACVDIVDMISVHLNFTYHFELPPDMAWGSVDENGTWNGLCGLFQRREVNIVCASFSLTLARTAVMDFTALPYLIEDTVIVYQPLQYTDQFMTFFMKPLSKEVWIVYMMSTLAIGFLVWCLVMYSLTDRTKYTLSLSVWYAIQTAVNQGVPVEPSSQHPRSVLATFRVCVVIIVATFGGNLVAVLSVPKVKAPFTNLEEMANQRQYKFGTLSSSLWESKFKNANNPTDAKVWSRILEMEASGEEVMWPDSAAAQRLLDGGLYAAIADNGMAEELLQNNCQLVIAPHRFLPNNVPMFLQKNSAYTGLVGESLRQLIESGTMHQIFYSHREPKPPCDHGSATITLGLLHLQGVFYLLAAGIGLATLALLVERSMRVYSGLLR